METIQNIISYIGEKMKGTILRSMGEMVVGKFGKDKWEAILEKAEIKPDTYFLSQDDVNDHLVVKVIEGISKIADLTFTQTIDAFGYYWATVYAPKIYKPFYDSAGSAKNFLLKLDQVHVSMTKNLPGAHPPHFEYEWKDDKTLVMKYFSQRGLLDLAVGAARGIGTYFNDTLVISKQGNDHLVIVFS